MVEGYYVYYCFDNDDINAIVAMADDRGIAEHKKKSIDER